MVRVVLDDSREFLNSPLKIPELNSCLPEQQLKLQPILKPEGVLNWVRALRWPGGLSPVAGFRESM